MKKLLLIMMVIFTITISAKEITIFHLNDTHGHAWSFSEYNNPNIGGFAVIESIMKQEGGKNSLFLHAGDINTGVPESDMQNCEPDIKALNIMNLCAMTVGNHEFDKTRKVLLEEMKMANFPFLSANIYKDGKLFFKPYIIKEIDGIKIAIFGLTTEETEILEPLYNKDLVFKNAVEVSKKLVPKLREKADIIIALTHLGIGKSTSPKYTTSNELAEKVNGIDLIIDGHSHTNLEKPIIINKTEIFQAKDFGEYLGKITVNYDQGKIQNIEWHKIPVNLKKYLGKDKDGKKQFSFVEKEYTPDAKVQALLKKYKEKGAEKLDNVICNSEILLDGERPKVRSMDTNLSNLLTDAIRWKVGADIALQNGGGIRSSIKPGKITTRDILTVLPFGNTLYVLNLKGSVIKSVLDFAAKIPAGKGSYLHTSGLTWTSENGIPKNILVAGKKLDLNKTYKVVTNNYLASGGDGYKIIGEHKSQGYDTGFTAASVLGEFMQKQLKGEISSYSNVLRYKRK